MSARREPEGPRRFKPYELPAWAAGQTTGSTARKAVLSILAAHANPSGQCWPGQDLIADEAEMSVRQVRDHLKELEANGYIRREPRRDSCGHRASDLYTFLAEYSRPAHPTGKDEPQTTNSGAQPAAERHPNRQLTADTNKQSIELSNIERGHTNDADSRFEEAWRLYQHPKGGDPKGTARLAWIEALAKGADPDRLIAACRTQGDYVRANSSEFPPQMQRWLREQHYEAISSYLDTGGSVAAVPPRGLIDPAYNQAWSTFRTAVVKRKCEGYVRSWIDCCSFDGTTIMVPSDFFRETISQDLGDLIEGRNWSIAVKQKTRGRVGSSITWPP